MQSCTWTKTDTRQKIQVSGVPLLHCPGTASIYIQPPFSGKLVYGGALLASMHLFHGSACWGSSQQMKAKDLV